jgi:hypothetical protein
VPVVRVALNVVRMDTNSPFSDGPLPPDIIKLAINQHGHVIRLSFGEIASGIRRLLHEGIPEEVISQVVTQAVAALAKEGVANGRNPSR